MMSEQAVVEACTETRYEVHQTDLPLSCPMPNMTHWDAHPRVYLDVTTKGQVNCPYCGALYVLVD